MDGDPWGARATVLLALHLGAQLLVLDRNAADARTTADRYRTAAHDLRRLGLTPPCLVSGVHDPPIGYDAGCASADVHGNNRDTTVHLLHPRRTRTHRRPRQDPLRSTPLRPYLGPHRLPHTGLTAYVSSHDNR